MFLIRSIGTIIQFIWKIFNMIRLVIINTVFFIILLFFFGLLNLIGNPQNSGFPPQSGLLVLDIEGRIVDTTAYDAEFYRLTKKLNRNQADPSRENSLFELTQKIEQAALDPNIQGIVLKLDNFVAGDLPSLKYLGKYLEKFKRASKPIYAIGAEYNQQQYYLASFANKIYLENQGSVSLYGLSANNLYFKSLLDKLKINTHVFRVGSYKSAVEPFTRDDMSSEAKQNTKEWLYPMWDNYLADIANQRELPTDSLVPDANTLLTRVKAVSGSMTDYAVENGIVDEIITPYDFEQTLEYEFNHPQFLSIDDYLLKTAQNKFELADTNEGIKPAISVVFVNGAITTGENSSNVAGSNAINKQIYKILEDNNIKAVVLRINSPGGSVFASESIRSALKTLRSHNIPVVVSMGGMAASGGYWIATESDYIIADKNTLTGSIGIFGLIPTFENSLSSIGINTDGVSTSPLANLTVTKDLPAEASSLIQMNIESGYDTFINIVANSRHMKVKDVDKIAQGQVWLGQEAKRNGLVDQIGDFDDAVKKAAELAEITDYQIDWLKTKDNLFDSFLMQYAIYLPKSASSLIYQSLPVSSQVRQQISVWDNLNDPQNRYIYCLSCSDVN